MASVLQRHGQRKHRGCNAMLREEQRVQRVAVAATATAAATSAAAARVLELGVCADALPDVLVVLDLEWPRATGTAMDATAVFIGRRRRAC
jgi:hypothetical protein